MSINFFVPFVQISSFRYKMLHIRIHFYIQVSSIGVSVLYRFHLWTLLSMSCWTNTSSWTRTSSRMPRTCRSSRSTLRSWSPSRSTWPPPGSWRVPSTTGWPSLATSRWKFRGQHKKILIYLVIFHLVCGNSTFPQVFSSCFSALAVLFVFWNALQVME